MTRHIFIILAMLLTDCGTSPTDKNNREIQAGKVNMTDNLKTLVPRDGNQSEDGSENNNATYFVVIADTNQDYAILHRKMFDLSRKFNIPIDTMGRFYNKTKNLIALPDNADDEIYAGDYYPRRFPSDNLSLEYLDFYQRQAGGKTIALVTGIYEKDNSADSALNV